VAAAVPALAGDRAGNGGGIFSLVAPVGLAFYTLKGVGYLVDVYRGTIRRERHLGHLATYIGFFPQLLSGLIERADHFLPQLEKPIAFSAHAFPAGLSLMLLGYLKKLVVADQLAVLADTGFSQPEAFSSLPLAVATLAFTFQIYFDFSGYTDLALGAGLMLGFAPVENFRRPYLAQGLRDFWHRWHISLSTWFRDYLYFPLGGSRVALKRRLFDLNLTFWASGLWHGAGLIHSVQIVGDPERSWPRTAERLSAPSGGSRRRAAYCPPPDSSTLRPPCRDLSPHCGLSPHPTTAPSPPPRRLPAASRVLGGRSPATEGSQHERLRPPPHFQPPLALSHVGAYDITPVPGGGGRRPLLARLADHR
jgi:hypothetical protein